MRKKYLNCGKRDDTAEIGETLGFSYKTVREFITRYNRRQRKLAAGIVPKSKGRPRKAEPGKFSMEYYKAENEP